MGSDPRLTFKTYAHLVPGYLHAQIDRLPAAPPPKFAAFVLHVPEKAANRPNTSIEKLTQIKPVGVEPTPGLEPGTYGLRNRCSTS
jgi:hypothetical protein